MTAYLRGGPQTINLQPSVDGENWTIPGPGHLADGLYLLEIHAWDRANNEAVAFSLFNIEHSRPTIVITTPAHGQDVTRLTAIRGAVSAPGLPAVTLSVQRQADGRYWSPYTQNWFDDPVVFAAATGGGADWSRTEGLPAGRDQLASGRYVVEASVSGPGIAPAVARSEFRVDRTGPGAPTIVYPAAGSFVPGFDRVTGTATGVTVRPIAAVDLRLRRTSDNAYWDGTAWRGTVSTLLTSLNNGLWSAHSRMPAGGDLGADRYEVWATAKDSIGVLSMPASVVVRADTVPPEVAIHNPGHNAICEVTPRASGVVEDNPGGSGLAGVSGLLRRGAADNLEFWCWPSNRWVRNDPDLLPGAWSDSNMWADVILTGNNWSLPLPNLTDGAYALEVRAVDNAGLMAVAGTAFFFSNPAGPDVSIAQPANNGAYAFTPAARGTATDPNGVVSVELGVARYRDGQRELYDFDLGRFATNAPEASTARQAAGTTDWQYFGMPQLPPGTYALQVRATDGAQRTSDYFYSSFRVVDEVRPTLTITEPAPGAESATAPTVRGAAGDNWGVAEVQAGLFRYVSAGPLEYWDWRTRVWTIRWDPLFTQVSVGQGVNEWSLELPALPGGIYQAFAIATDIGGNNSGYVGREFRITDRTAPVVTVQQPAANQFVRTLPDLAGTLTDEANGSGPSRVELQIVRGPEGQREYWTGAAWTGTATFVRATLSGTNWSYGQGPEFASLANGTVTIWALGYDNSANSRGALRDVTVDTALPTVHILAPAHQSELAQLDAITGTLDDGPNGSGPGYVELLLSRVADARWWDGGVWVDHRVSLLACVSGTAWAITNGLPGAAHLPAGAYTIAARGYDRAGNGVGLSGEFRVPAAPTDTAAPTAAFVSPADGAVANSLGRVKASAADSAVGSGLDTVSLMIVRNRDGAVWQGGGWALGPDRYLAMSFVGGLWDYGAGPSGGQLEDGDYSLSVAARDVAGNEARVPAGVLVDQTAPLPPALVSPAPGSTNTGLTELTGTAEDNAGGSGLAGIDVALTRDSDGRFWNGIAWTNAPAALPAIAESGQWNVVAALPGGAVLPVGAYSVAVTATDRAGNRSVAADAFHIAQDARRGGAVQLQSASYMTGESNFVRIAVVRVGGSDGAACVDYTTADGTAAAGTDYTGTSGVLKWNDGDSADKTFDVPILEDALYEGAERFTVSLSGASGAVLGDPTLGEVTIADDDQAPDRGVVQLKSPVFRGGESDGRVRIIVTRVGGSDGAASVGYATVNGTATAGEDYAATNGTLRWADGESADRTFDVLILGDSTYEGEEGLVVNLTGASGAMLGSLRSGAVTIHDDEGDVGVTIAATRPSVVESGSGFGEFTLARTGPVDGDLAVRLGIGGTASNSVDYRTLGTAATVRAGSATVAIPVVPVRDDVVEDPETVIVSVLGGPGYALGAANRAAVTIEPSPVDRWRRSSFGGAANASNAQDTADFDGDGKRNLMEYVLDQDASKSEGEVEFTAQMETTPSNRWFTVYYTRRTNLTDATVWVQVSTDLGRGIWLTGPDYVRESVVSTNGDHEVIQARIVPPAGTRDLRAVRLRATRP